MRSYCESAEIFPSWALRAFREATAVVGFLQRDKIDTNDIRCHELARVVLPFLENGWEVVDGKFGPVEHTWLQQSRIILDVYAVGRLPMVQLVEHMFGVLPWHPGKPRTDIREDVIRTLNYEAARFGGFNRKGR